MCDLQPSVRFYECFTYTYTFMYLFGMKYEIAASICCYHPNHSSGKFNKNIVIPNFCVRVDGVLNDFGMPFLCVVPSPDGKIYLVDINSTR